MFCFFGHKTCGILAPQLGIELTVPGLEGKLFNHWTAREVPGTTFFICKIWNKLQKLTSAALLKAVGPTGSWTDVSPSQTLGSHLHPVIAFQWANHSTFLNLEFFILNMDLTITSQVTRGFKWGTPFQCLKPGIHPSFPFTPPSFLSVNTYTAHFVYAHSSYVFGAFFHNVLPFSYILYMGMRSLGFPHGSTVKNLSAMQEMQVRSLGREDPLEKEWQPTQVFLLGKSHGQKSLAGYSPWGHKEPDTI